MKTPLFSASVFAAGIVLGSLATTRVINDQAASSQPCNSPSTANFALDSRSSTESKVSSLASQGRSQIKLDFIPTSERQSRTRRGFPCVTSPEGAFGVEGHGTPRTMFYPTGEPMSARELAKCIQNDSRYHTGMTVYLLCCETGKGDRSFAQRLADMLGTEVVAPTEKLWPLQDGKYIVAQERMRKTAGLFSNGEKGEQRADVTRLGEMKTFRPASSATLVAASTRDDASQSASSSSAASVVRTQQTPKKPLLRASARTAALLAGIPRQDDTVYLNSRDR